MGYTKAAIICEMYIVNFAYAVESNFADRTRTYNDEWCIGDCRRIRHSLNEVIYAILDTCMADHFRGSLYRIKNSYDAAMENDEGIIDIDRCKATLIEAMEVFSEILLASQTFRAIKKS